MGVVYILLLIQGITGELVLYQPQNIVSVEVNGTAFITCVSSEDLEAGLIMSWYHRKWRSSEAPVLVKSCNSDNDPHKYVCKNERYTAWLEIHNVQITDSGVYYCVHTFVPRFPKSGNGTNLNVGDKSTSRSSIHILGHLQPQRYNSSLLLACVVLAAHNTVHLYWNISGTYHKGQIISREESDGTWTVMNFISLPKDNWNHVERMTCEAWITSSPTSVHWEIPGQDAPSHRNVFHDASLTALGYVFFILLLTALLIRMWMEGRKGDLSISSLWMTFGLNTIGLLTFILIVRLGPIFC